MEKNPLNKQSSREEKKSTSDVVFEKLGDYLFDRVAFVTLIFSEAKQISGSTQVPITSTTNFGGTSRITDTSEGKYFNTGRESRMRCSFYLENPDDLEGYILSPVVYDSFGSLNSIASLSVLRSYVGLKFMQGSISVAVKEAGFGERLFNTNLSLTGSGATDTWELEIKHYVNYTEIFVNNSLLGSYSTNMIGSFRDTMTYLPLFAPGKSTDGSAVGIVIENYQFIQNK